MPKLKYTPALIAEISKRYPVTDTRQLAAELGLTYTSLKTYATRKGIKKANVRHVLTIEEKERIIAEFPTRQTQHLANEMGLKYHTVSNFAYSIKLKKTPEFLGSDLSGRLSHLRTKGVRYRFPKGHVPGNKGKKMDQALYDKCKPTMFKKGNRPPNTKYDGCTSIRTDNTGNQYLYQRVSKAIWKPMHRLNWEKQNGPIPNDKILRCIDGNSLNCDPQNWELINRAGHLDKNAGRTQITDEYVITMLSMRHPELKDQFSQMPEIIQLKRSQILLKRTINELSSTTENY